MSSSSSDELSSVKILKHKHDVEETDDAQAKRIQLLCMTFREWSQFMACIAVTLFHVSAGASVGFSSILIPQLELADSDMITDKNDHSWIASSYSLTSTFALFTVGYVADRLGRLSTLTVGVLPLVLGWTCIALAPNVSVLLAGRILTAVGNGMTCTSTYVYISEIISPDLRGAMSSLPSCLYSIGLIFTYTMGTLLHWRSVAWFSILPGVLPLVLHFSFASESPVWLMSRGRTEDAEKSLRFLLRSLKKPEKVEKQLSRLLRNQNTKKPIKELSSFKILVRGLAQPTGYKPFFILIVLFIFQKGSGTSIPFAYGVSLFQAVGSTVDPYICTVGVGVLKLVFGLLTSYLLQKYDKRNFLMISGTGMAVCMFIAGFITREVTAGQMEPNIIPTASILLYLSLSICGLFNIPWTMTAELFSLDIRGVASGLIQALASTFTSIVLKIYPFLPQMLGGIHHVLWMFAGVSFASVVFVYVFLPQTHNKSLAEIQNSFRKKSVFVCRHKLKSKRELENIKLDVL